mgnify:CR=1 FL=1
MRTAFLTALLLAAFHADAGDDARERECRELKEQIERIHARRRMGYSAKAGRRMKQRLRELEKRRARACR